MASRPILSPFPVIIDGDMSSNVLSNSTVIQNISAFAYDIGWSGTGLAGSFSVQVSNTYSKNADGTTRNTGDWTDVPLGTAPIVASDTGGGYINVVAIAGYATRLVYTSSAGTGLLNATICGKVG